MNRRELPIGKSGFRSQNLYLSDLQSITRSEVDMSGKDFNYKKPRQNPFSDLGFDCKFEDPDLESTLQGNYQSFVTECRDCHEQMSMNNVMSRQVFSEKHVDPPLQFMLDLPSGCLLRSHTGFFKRRLHRLHPTVGTQ